MASSYGEAVAMAMASKLYGYTSKLWHHHKMQSGRENTLEERYAISSVLNLEKLLWTILHEPIISFSVAQEIQGRQGVREG